ncbi:AMP-binding enzyme [Rhizoctonia solani AG-3 Rhs1AP]|uniref:AMP-binding enzyme n=1 Tax=Rhizoctonia solani AG-3 Rhs1AP TaxID=1086054 RepID=A0A0A1UJJ1_9AGAM|nr:AMP-binding enzyme [Rhizoctonia solani AG-3 Rhs1AP]
MASITHNPPTDGIYTGPKDDDPLTEKELAILLAIPRGAEKAPTATIFRLPLGPDPTQGWVDVTFSEARSIIARLAVDWKARLSEATGASSIGPGMTVCLLVQPIVHVILHWLAFWALGCSIQVISLSMDNDTIALYLRKSGCQVVVHSGISDTQVAEIRAGCNAAIISLPKEEHAHEFALSNKHTQTMSTLPWPEPCRPDPAIISHSSGSTGTAKLVQVSLYFCTLGIPDRRVLEFANLDNSIHDPRPNLILSPSYWSSFNTALTNQLVTGTPMAFAHVFDIAKFPSSEFIGWARGLGVGGVVCAPRFIRDIVTSGSEADISFLQGFYNIIVGGSALDGSTAALVEKYKLKFMNAFGCTELGAILIASQPPYTHLHLLPGPSPLVLPISDVEPDGSRQVQIWYSRFTSPQVAHLHTKGGMPLHFEPFPGDGPHKGELAVKLDDIFKEVRTSTSTGSQASYIYLGRSDDLIKIAGRGGWDINASAYETQLTSAIISYLANKNKEIDWTIDGVQLFGHNRPCTALVIQLRPAHRGESTGEIGQDILEHLPNMVELVNTMLKLDPVQRVDPQKRMLVIASNGKAYGPGASEQMEDMPRLMMTHKHTLQRWRNVEAFGNWLDGLDYT